MRRLSFLYLGLTGLAPLATWWLIARERRAFAAKFGAMPEGTGLFATAAAGALVTLLMSALCVWYALRAFRALEPPRGWRHALELGLLCLPLAAVIAWICLGLLGLPQQAPPVIQTE